MHMNLPLSTFLFFPDWPNGLPGDLFLVHLFFFLIFIPFTMIFMAARSHERENPNAVANALKASKAGAFFGYEYRTK